MESKVRHFRLVNSEEIIGELEVETKNSIFIKNPYLVGETTSAVVLSKYVPFSENQTIEIKKDHVITITALHEEMIRYYHNSTEIGKTSSRIALKGLVEVNEQMENYIYGLDNSDSFVNYSANVTHAVANTVH